MTDLCGVLGVVEAALGSSIPSLAVSGPHSATENDGHDDSLQQTGELFADWQPGVTKGTLFRIKMPPTSCTAARQFAAVPVCHTAEKVEPHLEK